MLVNSITELIGNTPLLKLDTALHSFKHIEIYAKLEYWNPFGSIKDRTSVGLLAPYWDEIKEKQQTIIEASSGNTARAMAALAALRGLKFKTVTNRIKIPEYRKLIQILGAELEELPGYSECPDPNDPDNLLVHIEKIIKQHGERYHYGDQYYSDLNPEYHYNNTGREIFDDLGMVDFFICGIGTSGSSLGAGRFLKEKNPSMQIIGTIAKRANFAPGLRNSDELFEVGNFRKDHYDAILDGTTIDGVNGMLELVQKAGMFCGPSTGLNYVAALKYLGKYDKPSAAGEKQKAVIIACDRLEMYLSFIEKYRPEIFDSSKAGKKTIYNLPPEQIEKAPAMTVEELVAVNNQADLLVIDIRGHFSFTVGHISGSINIFDYIFAEMVESGDVFPKEKRIVIACRIAELSPKYAAFLSQRGYQAYYLAGGISAWKRAGLPLEKAGSVAAGE